MTFQYLIYTCIPVYDISIPDIDCSWHFMVLYLGKIPIISMYVFFLTEISCA